MGNSNYDRQTHRSRDIGDCFFRAKIRTPGLTPRGHRRWEVKVDLEVLGMGSY